MDLEVQGKIMIRYLNLSQQYVLNGPVMCSFLPDSPQWTYNRRKKISLTHYYIY